MKIKKIALKSLLALFCTGALITPGIAQAKASIDTLDFALTGSWELDCEILGNVDLERDPSWTNEEYYIHLVEEYIVQEDPESYPTVETYQNDVKDFISGTWDSITKDVYLKYAEYRYEDFKEREDYYSEYHSELEDEYYRVFNLYALGFQPESDLHVEAYDIIANYCSSSNPTIGTTYGWGDIGKMLYYGYKGYIKLDNNEINLEDEPLLTIGNSYYYHKDGFADFSAKLERVDETTIKAVYSLKNLTEKDTDFGLAFYGDTAFKTENYSDDYAATTKTNRGFATIQDNPNHTESFGARLNIDLNPIPTTTYVGYYTDAQTDRWKNSIKDSYTAMDNIDTGISYSWQGSISAKETKTFSATYRIDVANSFINNFYFLKNSYEKPLATIEAIDGGALELPFVSLSEQVGHHHEWNTKPDQSGNSYGNANTIIAHKDQPNYYEVDTPNRVESEIRRSQGRFREQSIVITDEIKERYKNLAESSLSNVFMVAVLREYDKDITDHYITEGPIDTEEISKISGENFQLENLFMFSELQKTYVSNMGYTISESLNENELPVTIRVKLPKEYTEDKGDFKIVEIVCDDMMESCSDYSPVTTTYNKETSELFFEVTNPDYMDMIYALSYTEKTPEEPIIGPESPDAPETGANTTNTNSATSTKLTEIATISLALIMTIFCLLHSKSRKNH